AGPNTFASRTPVHAGGSCGGRQRRFPVGGAAYGMPRKAASVGSAPKRVPLSIPESIVTRGSGNEGASPCNVLPANTRPKRSILLNSLFEFESHATTVSMGRTKPIEFHGRPETRARKFGTEVSFFDPELRIPSREPLYWIACGTGGSLSALPAGLLVAAHHLQEQLLHTRVRGHLRMEGGHEQFSLAHKDREAVALGENLDARSHARDARRADEDHLERVPRQLRGQRQDGGVDLAAVRVPLHRGVQHAQAALLRMQHLARHQNATCAGGKTRRVGNKLAQPVKESMLFKKLEHGGRFASRQNQAVEALKLFRLAHQDCACTGIGKSPRVCRVVALQGEQANRDRMGVFGVFLRRSVGCGYHRVPCLYDTGSIIPSRWQRAGEDPLMPYSTRLPGREC